MVGLLSNDYKRLLDKKRFKPRLRGLGPSPPHKIILREGRNSCIHLHKIKIKRILKRKMMRVSQQEELPAGSPEQGCGISSPFVYLSHSHIEINVCPQVYDHWDWLNALFNSRRLFSSPGWPLLFLKFDCSHCGLIFCKCVEDSKAFPLKLNNSVTKDQFYFVCWVLTIHECKERGLGHHTKLLRCLDFAY